MALTCTVDLRYLKPVLKALAAWPGETRSPWLDVRTEDAHLLLTARHGKTTVRAVCPAWVQQPGRVVLSVPGVLAWARSLSVRGTVDIEDLQTEVQARSAGAIAQLPPHPLIEVEEPAAAGADLLSLDNRDFGAVLRWLPPMDDSYISQYPAMGKIVLVVVEADAVWCVASNGHFLACVSVAAPTGASHAPLQVCVERAAMHQAAVLMPRGPRTLRWRYTPEHIHIRADFSRHVVQTPVLARDSYPSWEAITSVLDQQHCQGTLEVPRSQLLASVRSQKGRVTLTSSRTALTAQVTDAGDPAATTTATIPLCVAEGPTPTQAIVVSPTYLTMALVRLPGEMVQLAWGKPTDPLHLLGRDGPITIHHVIMPLRQLSDA